ncbi:MAG: ABC transporter substrate-binding protein [Gudongella sp.]|nr:ABC transporter substrate-binding protein [Gudongella sp.]
MRFWNKKALIGLVLVLMMGVVLSGCKNEVVAPAAPVKFTFMEGVTALTAAYMMDENMDLGREIEYNMVNAPDLLLTDVLKEEADIAIVPSNLAAQAWNKDIPYRIAGTSTWGNIYVVGRESLTSLDELKGREIYLFGKGLTPDLVWNVILKENGLNLESDMNAVYVASAAELGPMLIGKKAEFAILPEPMVSAVMLKDPDLKVLFDLNELWANSMDLEKGYPQSSLVIKQSLIDNDPEFVAKFLESYEASIAWAMDNPEALGDLSDTLALGTPKPAIIKGLDRMNIGNFKVADSITEYEEYFKACMDFAPEFIGGAIPDETIFYIEK